jgi:hypothetical protein
MAQRCVAHTQTWVPATEQYLYSPGRAAVPQPSSASAGPQPQPADPVATTGMTSHRAQR